jgi:hypothetical protein
VRLAESEDEVIVTYEMKGPDGARGRNTEILTFKGEDRNRLSQPRWMVPRG